MTQATERSIVAFNASGRPREILLRMRVTFRVADHTGIELVPQTEVTQIRDLSINEAEILANPISESALNDDMQKDIAWQILRRLRSVKLSS
jgi:LPS-assembly lipoprotein